MIHLAHPQIKGTQRSKTVQVRKFTPLENVITHPRFEEVTDTFELTVTYQLAGSGLQLWDTLESNIEDVEEEVVRILKTVHNPFDGTGGFFRVMQNWRYADELDSETPVLKRILLFSLTKIRSDEDTVFSGFGGVLAFDVSGTTNADNPPGADYIFTEAFEVTRDEGIESIPVMTSLSSSGTGVPARFRGMFTGTLTAITYAKKDDLDGSTAEKLDNIYKAQNNGEHIVVALLDTVTNTETPTPATLEDTTLINVTRINKKRTDENLVLYRITGDITAPTITAVT